MEIRIPELSLVVLIGASGCGKSTFARAHFAPTEVLSSDVCRGLVSDDENDQQATGDAFDLLHYIAAKRLARGRLTLVDATNVQSEARKPLVKLAREYHCLPVAIVLNMPESLCQERNRERPDRNFGPHVVRQQRAQLGRSIKALKREGFRHIHVLRRPEDVDAVKVIREPLWNDKREERGPFDMIGDVHGCGDELEALLAELGYRRGCCEADPLWGDLAYVHPEGRKAVFLGDLADRGPRILDSLKIARNMVQQGSALCVPGNHEIKLMRKLKGKNVRLNHGLAESIAEIEALPEGMREPFVRELTDFIESRVSHYVLDKGRLVVAHAGMKASMQGRGSGRVREFALYGETTGEIDEFGLPVRYDWAAEYRGQATVVYGHTPVPQAEWLNRTINIDTGCVFGGKLSALRYPENELVSVDALKVYCEPVKPFLEESALPERSVQHEQDDILDADDVLGKRIVSTRLRPNITIREENAAAALEVMSRYAVDPKWLIYLPPTMSPSETSQREGWLEHPAEAFDYYRNQGVPSVVCQEKHMGSRTVVVICRDEEAASRRFGAPDGSAGSVYTRTGRPFFSDPEMQRGVLARLRDALTRVGFWGRFDTDWACFDCELMPWSAKARELLRTQYAAVGAAGKAALPESVAALKQALERIGDAAAPEMAATLADYQARQERVGRFTEAYRRYCWEVEGLGDLKLAPFHLMATEKRVHIDQTHLWHMRILAEICGQDPDLLLATRYRVIELLDPESRQQGARWWESLTEQGGEGMVIKPLDWIQRGKRGLIQPALKCRGREYLRIIYGPDYTDGPHLARLRSRGLGRKRSLASREFALGIEALERFVRKEPLRRIHECVFGVLAMESEPVDPRL